MGIEDEILIEVEELPNYLISNKGNIFSKKKKLFKKFFIVNNYYRVQVIKDKERKSISRSQIVYRFYNNDYRLFQGHLRGVIHHKNTNTLDDDIDNLKLITNRENCSIEKTLKSGLPVGVDGILIYGRNSVTGKQTQRKGRGIRKEGDKFTLVVNVVIRKTKDEAWLKSAQWGTYGQVVVNSVEELVNHFNNIVK